MGRVTTKRHISFYVNVAIQLLLCIGLASLTIYLLADAIKVGVQDAPQEILGVVVSIAMLIGLCVLLYRHSTSAPIITVDKEKICVGKQTYQWNEMGTITMTGRINSDVPFIGGMEGMSIIFKGDHGVYILNDVYTNLWQVKQFIRQELADMGNISELPELKKLIEKHAPNELKQERFQKFAGWVLISKAPLLFGTFMLLFLLVFSFSTAIFSPSHTVALFVLIFVCILSWIATAQLTSYFKVSQNFLVVKNHLIWRRDAYSLEDILEIEMVAWERRPQTMRVTTKDYQQRVYYFTTLRQKTTERMIDQLKQQGIDVCP